jgi:hypothetical protein
MKQASISTENFEFILKKLSKAGGEKIFRPKVLMVASLAECALSSCLSFQLEAYLIKFVL